MRLLIIGQLQGYMSEASKIAMAKGARVNIFSEIDGALEAIRLGKGGDLIFIDVELDVSYLMASLKRERISIPVVTCGINIDSKTAAQSIRLGANEYIPLPPDPDLIAAVLATVASDDVNFIYTDPRTQEIITLAERIAPSNASILITGESGTGKEVISKYIHSKSHRSQQNFISVNCAAIPENLLESELFGHEKGAFTGAVARRIGKFEEASGGTLLLDEISEMHPHLQAKLLRAIQEQEIDRVGGSKPIKVDIRLLATSNRNLEEEVKNGTFREDLYFRLNVVNIEMPALRERPGDIPVLANTFLKKYSEANGLEHKKLSNTALHYLENYHWPGNVRELENAMHRAVLLSQGTEVDEKSIFLNQKQYKKEEELCADSQMSKASKSFVGRTVSDVERDLIIETVHHCLGNRTQAANILGISIRTLRNKLRQYTESGIDIPASHEKPESSYSVNPCK